MGEVYTEVLIQKQISQKDRRLQIVLIIQGVLFLVMSLLAGRLFLLVGTLLAIATLVYINPRFHTEYEYEMVNREFRIDSIYSKKRRKHERSFNLEQVTSMTPLEPLQVQMGNPMPVLDYSSGNPAEQSYELVVNADGVTRKILITPNEELLNNLKMYLGNRVHG